jgi:hypothetical protein
MDRAEKVEEVVRGESEAEMDHGGSVRVEREDA